MAGQVRRVVQGVFLLIFGVFAALVLVEVGFRVVSPPVVVREEWNDRPPFYYLPEGATTFQDAPYTRQKEVGRFRIAVVGDSFAFAPYLQYDDTFVKRLERMLNLNLKQPRIEVINYGVPRYSTHHEVKTTERALKEGADLVILQVTLNDPELKPYRPTGLIVGEVNRWGQLELTHPLFRYWKSLAFVVTRIYNSRTPEKYRKYFFDLFEKPATFNNFKDSVEQIAQSTKNAKVPVVAVTFPLFGVPVDDGYPFLALHAKVQEVMDASQIPNLDLFSRYKGIPHDRLKVMPLKDFHPNEIAHRIAAEALYEFLAERGLFPAEALIRVRAAERIDIRIPKEALSQAPAVVP